MVLNTGLQPFDLLVLPHYKNLTDFNSEKIKLGRLQEKPLNTHLASPRAGVYGDLKEQRQLPLAFLLSQVACIGNLVQASLLFEEYILEASSYKKNLPWAVVSGLLSTSLLEWSSRDTGMM